MQTGDVSASLDQVLSALDHADPLVVKGRVRAVIGTSIRANIPGIRIGETVRIERNDGTFLIGEVVGFNDNEATIMPLGPLERVGLADPVVSTHKAANILCSPQLLGRVLDGMGEPIDGGASLEGAPWPVMRRAPLPLDRPHINEPFNTGIRAIDAFLTMGKGQRLGIFAPSGVGKSTLLAQLCNAPNVDVVVASLIAERSREVRDFIEVTLSSEVRAKTITVCAASDTPAMVRVHSGYVATAIAEYFRDQGKHVLLIVDSLTRFARAAREVGLAALEPPTRRGYPPSVFARLAQLVERAGTSPLGTITAIYSVLVEGNDLDEPVSDEVRGLLDGHIVLDPTVAARSRYPAIDITRSLSRVMDSLIAHDHRGAAKALRQMSSLVESKKELISLGAYRKGTNPELDRAVTIYEKLEDFLNQPLGEITRVDDTLRHLVQLSNS